MMMNKTVVNIFFGIFAGLASYAIVGKLGLYLLEVGWTNYAAHTADKSYTFGMLLARQLVGISAAVASGIASGILAKDRGIVSWWVSIIVFCRASYIHFMTKTWADYPLWYHFTYVGLIIPVIRWSRALS